MVRKSWALLGVVALLALSSGCGFRDRPGLLARFRARSAETNLGPSMSPTGFRDHGMFGSGMPCDSGPILDAGVYGYSGGMPVGMPCSSPGCGSCPCGPIPGGVISGGAMPPIQGGVIDGGTIVPNGQMMQPPLPGGVGPTPAGPSTDGMGLRKGASTAALPASKPATEKRP